MSLGVVFLSSIFKGLEETRPQVVKLLERLGYYVWWAEALPWPEKPPPALIAATCLAGIDKSDYYLGVYPSRYGSDPLGVGFTELDITTPLAAECPGFCISCMTASSNPRNSSSNSAAF
jgi:hypothetical protein